MNQPTYAPGERLLFIGDSITDAFRKPEEINDAFQLGNGHVFLIAARHRAAHPGSGVAFLNRGISGHTIADLEERWDRDCLDLAPDLVTILIGVNETVRAMQFDTDAPAETYAAAYRRLIDRTRARLPETRIVLMDPFVLDAGIVTPAWHAHLDARRDALARLAEACDLPLLPLQRLFDEACGRAPAAHWAYDGFHPSAAGFQLIAEAWESAVAYQPAGAPAKC